MKTLERQAILQALERSHGNRQRAAQMLGIGLRTLQKKLKEYGLTGRGNRQRKLGESVESEAP